MCFGSPLLILIFKNIKLIFKIIIEFFNKVFVTLFAGDCWIYFSEKSAGGSSSANKGPSLTRVFDSDWEEL